MNHVYFIGLSLKTEKMWDIYSIKSIFFEHLLQKNGIIGVSVSGPITCVWGQMKNSSVH
jgi:hypothetical protein